LFSALLPYLVAGGLRGAPWLELPGRDLGDPHITTDSWENPDCSVSEAGPAAAPGRLPAGVINTTA